MLLEREASGRATATSGGRGRLLVVSHPSVVAMNQAVYARLVQFGWDVLVVVPDRWRHEYSPDAFRPGALPGLERRLRPLRVVNAGRPQRHFYAAAPGRLIRSFRPDVAFFEEECFSLSAAQWGRAASRLGVPFGVQAAENLDRPLPLPARVCRSWILKRASFVAARSPASGELVQRWGGSGQIRIVPHTIPAWGPLPRRSSDVFTVGYAGRLVPEKGVWDLVHACALLQEPVRLLFVGDGPLRPALEATQRPTVEIRVVANVSHDRMPSAYAEMDLLVLPSRTTPRWAEQFGRVLVEALSCGVPVVGSDSGEIPWVIQTTGGGRLFGEGDIRALADVIAELRDSPGERAKLALRGQAEAARQFALDPVADALDRTLRVAARPPGEDIRADIRPSVALVAHGVHDGGGMERACAELVRRGSDRYRFVVFATELAPGLRRFATWKRIAVPRRPIPLKLLAFAFFAGMRLSRSSTDLVHTVGAIVPNHVDIASVHLCHSGFRERTGRLAPPGRTLPRRVNTGLTRLLAVAAERWSYRPARVKLLAPVSAGVADELKRHYPRVPTRLAPNGINRQRFRPDAKARRELRVSEDVAPDDVVALFVGGDWDHKGVALSLEALARARSRVKKSLCLWVVGRGDERRFQAVADSVGAGRNVRFFGVRGDPERFYQAADVFLLPTLYETFSLVAYEAAASGLPIVATAVSGIEELIGKDEAGILVERTPESVASALVRLAADPKLRARLGEVGLRRASEYTWERSVESVLGLYRELLADRQAVTA